MAETSASAGWQAEFDMLAAKPYSFAARLDMLFEKIRHPVERNRDGIHRKWKQSELAEAIGVSEAYVSKLRRGGENNPALDLIRRIAKFFDVSASVLVDDDPAAIEYIVAQMNLYSALLNSDLDVAELASMLSSSAADQPTVLRELLRAKEAAASLAHASKPFGDDEGSVSAPSVLFRAPTARRTGELT